MQRSRLAGLLANSKKLGIAPVEVAEFEEGQRIDTERGGYEWWYFDSHLDNGATLVVVFYTKPNVMITIGATSLCRPSRATGAGRAPASVPITIIASHITAAPAYGYETQIVCMLAMDSKITAGDYATGGFFKMQLAPWPTYLNLGLLSPNARLM